MWTCEPGWEESLVAELTGVTRRKHEALAPGWIRNSVAPRLGDEESAHVERPISVALAAQCLPDAIELSAPSINAWARQCGEMLIERLQTHAGPWRLHVFSRYPPGDVSGRRRCELIDAALREFFERRQRRLLRTLTTNAAAAWQEGEWLVQLGLREATRGVLSCCPWKTLHLLRRVLSRFPAGEAPIRDEPEAPSRAYRKLAEVQLRLNRAISAGERCVDLGSSPGSWAWLALKQGAVVTAIDRSPLREDLMEHPRLEFGRGDAFKYAPDRSIDWLLCDVIAFPQRSLELLERWLSNRWCRQFCVTIKFRGQDDYRRLTDCKSLLDGLGAEYCLRRLSSNRNEVTAYGFADPSAGIAMC